MGSLAVDIKKQERDYINLSLSDVSVVKLLISYRDSKTETMNQELIGLFIYLDDLIEKCNFNEKQKLLLEYASKGYSMNDISKVEKSLGTTKNVSNLFNKICSDIVDMNKYIWRIYIHKNYLNTDFQECTKCNLKLPIHDEFFRKRGNSFSKSCRKCR